MAILWLDRTSGPTLNALTTGYEIGNPKAGDDTHLIDHTWLALVATAGMPSGEFTLLRQPENWRLRSFAEGGYSDSTVDFSEFEDILSNNFGFTLIVQVDHTPGRMTSDEYAEGEYVNIRLTHPIHSSLKSLAGKVSALESDNATLQTTITDLTARLEALEDPTNPE